MTTMQWSALSQPAEVAKGIGDLYRRRGANRYDEAVSQTEHALQCASLAMSTGASDDTVVAALLHDIGHLLVEDEHASSVDRRHEDVGTNFLRRWFGPAVLKPIELHVTAKRYLCAVEPEYVSELSPASVRSLEMQGGPMSGSEISQFEAAEHCSTAVDLRRWDDQAKSPNAPTPGLGIFEQIMQDVLCRS